MLETRRMPLPTGVTLNVQVGGAGEPVIFLHGFPESHRTWRHQMTDLSRDHLVVAPDQRGFGGSDKPQAVEEYGTEKPVADLLALADALGIERFTLVGHDWGGAVAWAAALQHAKRVRRLVIVNAPHPAIFQRTLIEDEAQRAASQYINYLRTPGAEAVAEAAGRTAFFEKAMAAHVDMDLMPPEERVAYHADWNQPGALTSMFNWYRASPLVVPGPGEKARLPFKTHLPFPHVHVPTLVIWGLRDKALLPVQLEGLDELVDDLRIVTTPEAGHFVTWEQPDFVTGAIRDFLAETPLD